jgi:hypothetical protein
MDVNVTYSYHQLIRRRHIHPKVEQIIHKAASIY